MDCSTHCKAPYIELQLGSGLLLCVCVWVLITLITVVVTSQIDQRVEGINCKHTQGCNYTTKHAIVASTGKRAFLYKIYRKVYSKQMRQKQVFNKNTFTISPPIYSLLQSLLIIQTQLCVDELIAYNCVQFCVCVRLHVCVLRGGNEGKQQLITMWDIWGECGSLGAWLACIACPLCLLLLTVRWNQGGTLDILEIDGAKWILKGVLTPPLPCYFSP